MSFYRSDPAAVECCSCCALGVCVTLSWCEGLTHQNCAQKALDRNCIITLPCFLAFHWRIVAFLPRAIAPDFLGKGEETGGRGGEGGEENQNKWPSSSSHDPICREICVLGELMVASGCRDSRLYFCLPSLKECHCQVTKGEVNGGEKSTRGHRYKEGKPHCFPDRLLAVWSCGH